MFLVVPSVIALYEFRSLICLKMSLKIPESLSAELSLLLVNIAFDFVTSRCNKENCKVSGRGAVIFVTVRI